MANKKSRRSFGKFLVDCAYSFVSFAVLVMLMWAFMFSFVLRSVEVDGVSMQDTLQNGQRMLLVSAGYTPKRGDIVVANRMKKQLSKTLGVSTYDEPIIKRVIGLPGDVVEVQKDAVFVNGKQLNEPYVHYNNNHCGCYYVPRGKVFLMGDHRDSSSDSRQNGPVDMENIMGHVVARINSISSIDVMKSVSYDSIPASPTEELKVKAMKDEASREEEDMIVSEMEGKLQIRWEEATKQ